MKKESVEFQISQPLELFILNAQLVKSIFQNYQTSSFIKISQTVKPREFVNVISTFRRICYTQNHIGVRL